MNPNYMNFFETAPSGGMSMGNNFASQAGFPGVGMTPGGSFMDMINGPPMMNLPGQQHMTRFGPYSNMYGPSNFGMENSAARLQQFARQQLTPRPNPYSLPGQNMQDPMLLYNMQMARMRMKSQLPDYGSQQRYGPPLPSWPRMPSSMPHLQQSPQRNPIDMMQTPDLNSNALRVNSMQPLYNAQQPPGANRKMPVLDEAPPSLRGQSSMVPQQQNANFSSQQYINRMFSNPPSTLATSVGSPSYSQNQQPTLNLNSDALNLPSMNFPSPQQQSQNSFSPGFLNNLTSDLNNSIPSSVPQSPKLTHFGPSPASSVTSFEQLTPSSTNQTNVTSVPPTPSFAQQSPNPLVTTASINYPQMQSLPMSPLAGSKLNSMPSGSDTGQSGQKFQPYFLQMQTIQQQINRLKQVPPTPQTASQIVMYSQQYQMIFKQYNAAKLQADSMLDQPSQQQPPQIVPQHATILQQRQQQQPSVPDLPKSLIEDGLNIPNIPELEEHFLNDDSKADGLFPAAFLGGSDLSSLFMGDPLDIKLDDEKKIDSAKVSSGIHSIKQEQKSFISQNQAVSNDNQSILSLPTQNRNLSASYQSKPVQFYQSLQPVRSNKQPDNFLFPFHHPQFAPQQTPSLAEHMMSISDFLSKSAVTTTITMSNNSMSGFATSFAEMPPILQEAPKQKGGKGRGKTGKGSGKGSGKGKAGRPPGSLNKRKKKEKEAKRLLDMDPDDFDNLAPGEMLQTENDETLLDPAMRRSLRERTKKKNYKDDFDYNLSDEEDGKKDENEVEAAAPMPVEPVISGGANQLVAYRPNLEAEGEIAIIEKILAMRSSQQEEAEGDPIVMVEEYFVKYKGYSYLHCEWGTVEQLARKDKRVHAKVRRYQQRRDMSFAFLNELDDEPFNPDYLEIDRVLDMQTTLDPLTNENVNHYLVKWRALPYEESTWELQMNIDESIIKQFHELKKPPPEEQRKFVPRPNESQWIKYEKSPPYKNGNKLHDYQLEGLNWLTFCWYKRMNCILADEMGLGKTIQSISLLCAIKQYGIRGPFLVIAPLSTIANWQREFENWTDINAIVYHGSAQSRLNIQQYEMHFKDEKNEFIHLVYKFEAIITTYEMVLSANSFLCTIPFRCLIIDEAHRLKNQKCKLMEGLNNLKMEHRVLLTGTPLQNSVEELFSLLNFMEPTRFPSQQAFLYEFGDLKTEGQVEKLQQILKPMMLRRLKEDVDQNIPSKEETIVEVELTTVQKKFYRAILEKNFSFLAKGGGYANLPNLMNTMMELRKCCNHPFLIKGAEEKILSESLTGPEDPERNAKQLRAMVESSGKMVLIDKLLPKLKDGQHKVLIFSQMIKVLNLIEDYLIAKRYLYERIDGCVQGNMRQAAIDRFCRPDSDRFVFLLCTRAGGLGINLTAADTVLIFDSDWNPQNDLQAQARCHRIGQQKPVKVYRLICRNTYEREMFDRASLKLGLDKAVLQNMNTREGSSAGQQAMTKKEVEDLLKKGAYSAVMETDEDASKFCEEDIDQILERRTQIVQIKGEGKGSTFAKASFISDKARKDIDLDDPDFWKKWAKTASVDLDGLEKDHDLIVDEPRKRKQTKRFGNDGDATVEMSDLESDDETYEPHKANKSGRNAHVGPIERAAWTRVECFKVEKMLLIYGWARWPEIISHGHFRQEVRHVDVEAISRTILAYCFRHYKTDEKTKQFFIDLINESVSRAPQKNDKFDITNQILGSTPAKGTRGRKRGNSGRNALRRLTHQYSKPALIECGADWLTVDPEQLIIDAGYRKHLQHHCNKIMARVRLLHCLQHDIIKEASGPITDGENLQVVEFSVPPTDGELPAVWWDDAADKSLLMGTYKHGYEKYRLIRNDPCLSYYHKLGPLQFSENAAASPDSINNPASVERVEDASDPEFTVSTKKKNKSKKDLDDEDAFLDSEDEKDSFSLTASPASTASAKENNPDVKSSNNPEFRWPLPTDMNTRLRRLIAAYQKSCEKEYLDIMKAEKDKQKQERLAMIAQERQRKKAELQQKWTRREESDFYRVVSNLGVVYDRTTKKYNWDKFRQLAKLDKKNDETLTTYYGEFMAMCCKVCGKSTEEDHRKYKASQLEEISEDRASRCMQRIKLLSNIREVVLVHEQLDERLKLCQISLDFPRWWEIGKHDKALLDGVAKHGLGRTEYHVLMDPDSLFKEIVDKTSAQRNKSKTSDSKTDGKLESLRPNLNGEHPEDSITILTMKSDPSHPNNVSVRKLGIENEDSDSRHSTDSRFSFPLLTDEYAYILSSWPKDRTIVSHLEKVCQCVLKGEWSQLTRFDINPMVTKLPTLTRPLVSTIGHFTHAESTSDKSEILRGEEAAGGRDFKIKSIDGLKLTVKTEMKKRKRRSDIDQDLNKALSPLKGDRDVEHHHQTKKLHRSESSELKFESKHEEGQRVIKKVIDGVSVVEVFHRHPRGDERQTSMPLNVQIHIPKTMSNPVSTSRVHNSKPILHFPANVKVPKVASSSVNVPSITSPNFNKVKLPSSPNELNVARDKQKGVIITNKSLENNDNKSLGKSKTVDSKTHKSSVQPVGIHINSPNANVRIQGSKIEVKEKPNIKREIDLSEVILKVPDPSKFLPNKDAKKRARPTKQSVKPLTEVHSVDHLKLSKNNPVKKIEHRKEKVVSSPGIIEGTRARPERSAKKKAKDSISEMTEAEHLPLKDLAAQHVGAGSPHSPRRQWSELHSPSHLANSREYYRYDYYPDRSPLSPGSVHQHRSQSPLMHQHNQHMSPEHRIHSPSLHSLHGRPLSPVHHRHSHSPPPHVHNHSPRMREHDDHIKHLHYTEPLSPRYRSRDSRFCYSDESRSPYYFEYRHDKNRAFSDDLDRHGSPPPYQHGRLSPSRDIVSPVHHKHEKFPFVHLTEPRSPTSRTHRHDHSPITVQEGRFPYGHILDWEGGKYRRGELGSPTVSSPSLDSPYHYQPLSRLTPDIEHSKGTSNIKSPGLSSKSNVSPEVRPNSPNSNSPKIKSDRRIVSPDRVPKITEPPRLSGPNHDKKGKKRLLSESVPPKLYSPPNKNPPLAFYPTDAVKPNKEGITKPKPLQIERSVIEIPEQTVRSPNERKTPPTVKRKEMGSLLERKIQGLKKQRMEQLNDSTSNTPSSKSGTVSSPDESKSKPSLVTTKLPGTRTKSISAVLDTLASNVGKMKSSSDSAITNVRTTKSISTVIEALSKAGKTQQMNEKTPQSMKSMKSISAVIDTLSSAVRTKPSVANASDSLTMSSSETTASRQKHVRTAKSMKLDNIAKNLTRSLEQSNSMNELTSPTASCSGLTSKAEVKLKSTEKPKEKSIVNSAFVMKTYKEVSPPKYKNNKSTVESRQKRSHKGEPQVRGEKLPLSNVQSLVENKSLSSTRPVKVKSPAEIHLLTKSSTEASMNDSPTSTMQNSNSVSQDLSLPGQPNHGNSSEVMTNNLLSPSSAKPSRRPTSFVQKSKTVSPILKENPVDTAANEVQNSDKIKNATLGPGVRSLADSSTTKTDHYNAGNAFLKSVFTASSGTESVVAVSVTSTTSKSTVLMSSVVDSNATERKN